MSQRRREPIARWSLAAVGAALAGAAACWGSCRWAGLLQPPVSGTSTAVAGVGGAVAGFLLFLATMLAAQTWHARAELVAARRSLASLALTTHEVLWRTDIDGTLTWVNGGAGEVLGYRAQDLVGRRATDLVATEQLALWRKQLRAIVAGGDGWYDVPLGLVHRDGSVRLVETSAQPIVDRKRGVVGFEGSLRTLSDARAEAMRLADLRDQVSALLADDALTIAFQPIVSLVDGRVVGVEALARFATEPYLPPDVWFTRAAEVGLGVALELQALRAALAALPALPEHLYVSLNAAPRTIADPGFLDLLLAPTTPLDRLVLEVTEHESIDDYSVLGAVLGTARGRGLRLAVDDAGAGYASFRHIVVLRPDHIKLDRELTAGIDTDPARRALASAVVVFALELDASVTAEGVETAMQLDTLRSLSVDAAQGYHLGMPSTDPAVWATWGPVVRLRSLSRPAG